MRYLLTSRLLTTSLAMDFRPHNQDDQFPLWAYLNQPLFDSHQPFVWRPKAFVRYYKVQRLERCWRLSEVRLLEHCWRQDLDKNK